ncbi:MAG: class I SAM-dependent methyltransferase [Deltaproteobacteria bacterium]|jgi:ubiquinone/menaquinone biosynthesis C-methylase UbiE|nr:MAG: class I SAM-dependent methyltransferase [Deltaproteobacteria bacterium]
MNTKTNFDAAKAEAFEGRIVEMLNLGSLALMTSLGHRTGLFDVMAGLPPSTSEEIARTAGLNERYVREWLGALTTARIIEHQTQDKTYSLPPEHGACLTRKSAPNNLAAFTQYIAVLGAVEDEVLEAFKHGAGVPYSSYKRFHEVMAEDSGQTVVAALNDFILPLIPDVSENLARGIDVVDIGCGSGRAVTLLAENFPKSRFIGLDISEEAIGTAREAAVQKGLGNAEFAVQDTSESFARDKYGLVTAFDAIHDQAKPQEVLQNVYEALTPGGTFLMQDIAASSDVANNMDHPIAPFLYTISCMHCMSVSLAGGGPGLGAMWGQEKALAMLQEAGFADIRVEQLSHDIQNFYYITKKP